ncbi:DUF4124 domain-containing protein [Exilibacterium tricleocarpae]|uniref:DUF4124 domain-containing protein n=1 Tax=Exilibacterium tricleocarpae TaxID=2591008 RepID=A0A545T1V1_9GAMM|nr:DUF4124 domain-containing protein [Exilibacterium tricleocarpae]TQV71208.1 DUF4124 domain-containing protein [Exilibacterium tricleocarpae]
MARLTTIIINLALTVMLAGLGIATASAGEVYRWVDDDGGINYTAHPPKNRPSEKVMKFKKRGKTASTPAGDSASATAPAQPRQPAAGDPLTARAEPTKNRDPERCNIARKNLETLRQNARVRIKEAEGEFRYLTPEEHSERIKESQQAIDESC